jgi:hypothetical protein
MREISLLISRDEEFARRLFGDLNRDFLRLPNDSKIIILSDSDDEEEEVREKTTDAEATPSSAARSPALIASTNDADSTDKGDTPDRVIGGSSSDGDEAGLL